MQSVIMCAI